MQYNIRLTEYTDTNTATLTLYDDFLGGGEDIKPTQKKHHIEPFTNTTIRETGILTDEEIFYKKQLNLQKSVARSKRHILELMRAVKWEFFVTFTFDPNKIDRTDFTLCCKKVRKWLQNQRRNSKDLVFICIPELHKDMESWHAHAVLANVENMQMVDSGHKTRKGQTIFNLSGWHWGFSTAIPIDNEAESTIKLARYITKYLTKESYMLAKNCHRYFASTNIPVPTKSRFAYTSEEEKLFLVNEIIDKLGYQVVWNSRYEGHYCSADYLELVKEDSSDKGYGNT